MKSLIVANWKMNPSTLAEAKQLFNLVKKGVKSAGWRIKNAEVVICPPFLYISHLTSQVSNIKLGAQDCFWENPPSGGGAFTGEISSSMLKNLGCQHVIVGHSERRRYFKETDEMINKKIKVVLKTGLRPILCIEKTSQIKKGIKGIIKKDLKKIIFAYEPVWAIGTGKACGIPEAKKVNLSIRKVLAPYRVYFGAGLKKNVLLYGGSINSQNARDFIKKAKFQGLLIGGASLDSKEFIEIVKNVSKA
jgi:triosephosphate isomerase